MNDFLEYQCVFYTKTSFLLISNIQGNHKIYNLTLAMEHNKECAITIFNEGISHANKNCIYSMYPSCVTRNSDFATTIHKTQGLSKCNVFNANLPDGKSPYKMCLHFFEIDLIINVFIKL